MTATCPSSPPSPNDNNWKRYAKPWGEQNFHCGDGGGKCFHENREPAPDDPQGECCYDEDQCLIDDDHEYPGCQGTPNQYPPSDPRHVWPDSGGILNNGPAGWWDSIRHDQAKERERIDKEWFRN